MEENRNYSKCSENYLGMHEKRALIVNGPSKIMEMQAHVLFSECTHNSGAKLRTDGEIISEVAFQFS